ncbi:hypothetical protein ACHAXA_000471 [Cyclostephanos tholiformis]|uniref:LITAF domain-containing protein n=1 Tax=Cyclostephanos tholiformis TaxID=382380 RepID=A0ABD3RED2_9STRA
MDPAPSAPPYDDVIPAVTATPVDASTSPLAKVVTTTIYNDGRQVTVANFQQPGSSTATAAGTAPGTTPAVAASNCVPGVLRRDLGDRPAMITCGHCNHTCKTRTISTFGACTFISSIVLIFCFLPLFWIPFICPSNIIVVIAEDSSANRMPNAAAKIHPSQVEFS